MLIALGVILSVVFGVWLGWRAFRKKPINAHLVMYLISGLTGIFTIAFFMTMDIPRIVKVLVAIILGGTLIFWAARQQRRKQPTQP